MLVALGPEMCTSRGLCAFVGRISLLDVLLVFALLSVWARRWCNRKQQACYLCVVLTALASCGLHFTAEMARDLLRESDDAGHAATLPPCLQFHFNRCLLIEPAGGQLD